MKDYFYDSLSRGFGNVIHTVHGPVGISIFSNEDDTLVQPVAYDSPTSFINQLSDEEKRNHILFTKIYDISDVDFNIEFTVYRKLHSIISDIEKTLY